MTTDGAVKCWGDNQQMVDSPIHHLVVPTQVDGLESDVTVVSAAANHTCAVGKLGHVWCWGRDVWGILGTGTLDNNFVLTPIPGLESSITTVAVAEPTACVVNTAGELLCWGAKGCYGDYGARDDVPTPVAGFDSPVVAVSLAGWRHVCAVTSNGAVLCWGPDTSIQAGQCYPSNFVSDPTPVPGLESGVVAVSVGSTQACALTSSGAVLCWEPGLCVSECTSKPSVVPGLESGVRAVSSGGSNTCAVSSLGAVLCWSRDGYQSMYDSNPTVVPGLESGIRSISVGFSHSCAITDTGKALCWGSNSLGQLGKGTIGGTSDVPVEVVDPQ